jgi:hypothetical protein
MNWIFATVFPVGHMFAEMILADGSASEHCHATSQIVAPIFVALANRRSLFS